MPLIWKRLQENKFSSFKPGFLNQDILENYFGCLRSHSHRFVNLTCHQFEGLFKTFLLNNMTSPHSVGANRMDDGSHVLESLSRFLQSARCQEVPQMEKEYTEESELKETSTKIRGNQILNLAWLK